MPKPKLENKFIFKIEPDDEGGRTKTVGIQTLHPIVGNSGDVKSVNVFVPLPYVTFTDFVFTKRHPSAEGTKPVFINDYW